MTKIRFRDIASAARVGTATVERVLNSRGNVRPETAEKVIAAARKLGYDRRMPALFSGIFRIEVLMVRPDTPFYTRLSRAFARIASTLDTSIVVHRTFLDELDAHAVAEHIANPKVRRSGLVVAVPDYPEVRARLREVASSGIPVVCVVNHIAGAGATFVSIDNHAAGRSAAFYMSRMLASQKGSLVALCHSGAYDVHKTRIRGFSEYLADNPNPAHTFVSVMCGLDDRLRSAELFADALRRYPDIIGIYNAGGANSAIASVLDKRRSKTPIMWIGHELSDGTRQWLRSGLMDIVLDQAPEIQARRAIDTILKKLEYMDFEVSSEPIRFLTVNRENL